MVAYFCQHTYYGQNVSTLTLVNFIGMIQFTLTALCFRYCYKKYHWQSCSLTKNIFFGFIFAIVAGVLVATLLTFTTKPFFFDLRAVNLNEAQKLTQLVNQIVFLTFSYMLIASGWAFIYVYSSENKRVKDTQLANLALQNSLKDAQLANLTNQLNPHFLFNSLNNIRFAIHENKDLADEMITHLAALLRYALESNQKEKVTLLSELEIVDKYILVQSMQLESRLQFKVHCPDKLKSALVPPMSLQLCVENAVKHGIEQLKLGGLIEIEVVEQDALLSMTVTNDKPALASHNVLRQSTQVGIQNIRKRFALLYGDIAQVATNQTKHIFKINMTFPKEY